MELWYRKQASDKKFKDGLKKAPLWQLKNLKVVFALEQRKGAKVKSRFESVQKEIGRRKKSV
jgi:hypothetical protein